MDADLNGLFGPS